MPMFSVWYTESNTYKVWFKAESLEAAQAMIDKIEQGEMSIEELPGSEQKLKGVETIVESPYEVD